MIYSVTKSWKTKAKVLVVQSWPTQWSVVHPGSSVHGILQARTLEWVAILFFRGSSRPRDQIQISCTAGRFFTSWAPGKPNKIMKENLTGHCLMTNWGILKEKRERGEKNRDDISCVFVIQLLEDNKIGPGHWPQVKHFSLRKLDFV